MIVVMLIVIRLVVSLARRSVCVRIVVVTRSRMLVIDIIKVFAIGAPGELFFLGLCLLHLNKDLVKLHNPIKVCLMLYAVSFYQPTGGARTTYNRLQLPAILLCRGPY